MQAVQYIVCVRVGYRTMVRPVAVQQRATYR